MISTNRSTVSTWSSIFRGLVGLIYFSMINSKELLLPPCEEMPIALCGEGRIKNFCPKICGRLFGEENIGNENKLSTVMPLHSTTNSTMTTKGIAKIDNKTSSSNETSSKKNFLAPKPIDKSSKNVTLAPEDQEDINEFFEATKSNFTSTTSIPTTSKPISNKTCDKVQPCIQLDEANQRFLQRCQTSQPPIRPSCHGFCRYDVPLAELKNAFVRGLCPVGETRLYVNAASAFNDNTQCCSITGVLAGRRGLCFPFCNPNGPAWPDRRDGLKYLPCLQTFEQIMRCHWAGLTIS